MFNLHKPEPPVLSDPALHRRPYHAGTERLRGDDGRQHPSRRVMYLPGRELRYRLVMCGRRGGSRDLRGWIVL
jgi:hypothetical protein